MDIFTPYRLDRLNQKLGLDWDTTPYTMAFFLVSKSEHNNQDPSKTFVSDKGTSVFTYAEPLSYDWMQRGVTMGVVGFTTANDGKASWGDAQKMLHVFHVLGGPDLLPQALRCHIDLTCAKHLCKTIESFSEHEQRRFVDAQFEVLTSKGGYLYESVDILRQLDIPVRPLLVAAIFDTLLNYGIGGTYCPLTWLRKNAVRGSKTKTLRKFLKWKRSVSYKNNHNSCKQNGYNRSDMFQKLLKKKSWDLDPVLCQRAVMWKMV